MKQVFLAIIACCLITTACKETKKVIDTEVLTGKYTISTINGASISPAASLQFTNTDKSINGNSGCNDFGGNYSKDSMAINIGQLMVTQAYCDESIMKNENALLKALKNTGTFSISEGVLTLYSKTDRSTLLTATKDK
ncbi:MAG: heat shock protein HslJ [Patiriisocius sp.]|jgi:heat shock protein HslJ